VADVDISFGQIVQHKLEHLQFAEGRQKLAMFAQIGQYRTVIGGISATLPASVIRSDRKVWYTKDKLPSNYGKSPANIVPAIRIFARKLGANVNDIHNTLTYAQNLFPICHYTLAPVG
jgi:hypothetical protein